jgi:arginyl-tRNA synthetase
MNQGTVKFLNDILADVGDKMHEGMYHHVHADTSNKGTTVMRKNEKKYEQVENPEQIADTLGISAVMVQDMKGKRINGYTFDINVCCFISSIAPFPVPQFGHANQNRRL